MLLHVPAYAHAQSGYDSFNGSCVQVKNSGQLLLAMRDCVFTSIADSAVCIYPDEISC